MDKLYRHNDSIYKVIDETLFLNTFSEEGSVHDFYWNGIYLEVEMQYAKGVEEDCRYAGPVVLYQGTDNKFWLRPSFEFYERFEQINAR